MNDFSDLEDQLRSLRPTQPSSELATRIERALAEPEKSTATAAVLPREGRFHFSGVSIGLGFATAAALILLAVVRFQQQPAKTPSVALTSPVSAISNSLVPAGLTQVVYHTRDEGLHFPNDSTQPMRRVRSQTRETLKWRNPKTGATLRISYPREEISLTPVSGQ